MKPGYRGLLEFCKAIEEPLEPYLRRIARAYFGESREVAAILPRGNWKTSLAAAIGVHHLLTVEDASVTVGAASVAQARIAFERMVGFAEHPAIAGELTVRHLELRRLVDESIAGTLRVVPSDGPRAHGLSSTLYIGDEVWAWRGAELLEAMQTGLVKRRDSKLLLISTPAAKLDSPLGRLRARALAQSDVRRRGVVTEAKGDLHWLEWSIAEKTSLDAIASVKRANPAPYIGRADLERQRRALPDPAFAQFHAGRWGALEGAWLPPGAWAECKGAGALSEGVGVWVGVDVGGRRAASAVAVVTEELEVEISTWQGEEAVLEVEEHVRELANRYSIREVAYDPWRFRAEALRLEERGLPMVEFPQTNVRMVPASEALFSAIVERRLSHPDDSELNRHVANAIAKQTPRGWRIDKSADGEQVDAVVALAMAVDRASQPARRAQFLGWL